MLAIYLKELRFFFSSVVAYLIIGFFIVTIGTILWVLPETNLFDKGYANMQSFFEFCPYIFMFFIPGITMHTFADENKYKTIELLLASRVSTLQIVVGKYAACMCVIIFTVFLSTIYYYILWYLSTPVGNLDSSAIAGSYLGLILLSACFAAIGVFASIFTNKQIVAFLVATSLCAFFYQAFDSWKTLIGWSDYALLISKLGIKHHYNSISRGVIDSRDLLYFIEFIFCFTWGSSRVMKSLSYK